MNSVEQILKVTQFTEVIDGVEFTLRLITAEIAARVIGSKTLGLLGPESKSEDVIPGDALKLIEGYLQACMISPQLGETSDPEADTITLDDLGLFAGKILTVVFEKSGFERLGKSEGFSEDTEEKT